MELLALRELVHSLEARVVDLKKLKDRFGEGILRVLPE